jgi:hypothetical protein
MQLSITSDVTVQSGIAPSALHGLVPALLVVPASVVVPASAMQPLYAAVQSEAVPVAKAVIPRNPQAKSLSCVAVGACAAS